MVERKKTRDDERLSNMVGTASGELRLILNCFGEVTEKSVQCNLFICSIYGKPGLTIRMARRSVVELGGVALTLANVSLSS
jgi:hypothetical protein